MSFNSDVLKLREKFHLFQNRECALDSIRQNRNVYYEFLSMDQEYKEFILKYLTGETGVKLTYDVFFKKIFRPDIHPERLEGLLETLLGEKVQVRGVLPNEGFRFSEKTSLVVMDILVELADGSLVNVEIQKIPYAFPGQRCACYSADLVLRQYARVKSERGRHFTYGDIKNVYTVVLMERSSRDLKCASGEFIHRAEQQFNTGICLPMVQKYIIVALDSYKAGNCAIDTEQDAWLHLLTDESPETILEILEKYPKFEAIYRDMFEFVRDPEEVIYMFSEELRILDENTVRYMIEKQREELEEVKREVAHAKVEKARIEQEKAQAEQEKAQAEQEKAQAEQEKAQAEQEKAQAEQEKAQAEQEYQNISRENESIRCDMETAREENAKLKDRIRELEKLLGETG